MLKKEKTVLYGLGIQYDVEWDTDHAENTIHTV